MAMEAQQKGGWSDLYKKEDWWAIWLALGLIVVALIAFWAGTTIKPFAVSPPGKWEELGALAGHFADKWPWYLALLGVLLLIFSVSVAAMGHAVRQFVPGFLVVFGLSVAVYGFSEWRYATDYNLEAPLVALAVGLVGGNLLRLPRWLDTAFRTEYYIKAGIILLGATLPLTLIYRAGPVAFLQATLVSLTTFFTIYLVGTRVAKLDRRFCATMGAGGSVCGVSASIAVGGAVKADKEQVAISISLVTIFAIVMIFVLPIVCKAMGLDLGIAGAWIGTSEFADAAGFAAAQALGTETDKAIRAYTLMKVIGRDIWIGLWSFALAIVSVMVWEKRERGSAGVEASEIWWRFPKFVLGFFAASIIISLVSMGFTDEAFDQILKPQVIAPIKTLRTWTFIFTFLSIGFTTRFRELAKFGWHPLLVFAAGVAVNVPLGYILSTIVFADYWIRIPG
jgi:uncharacterized integral membrane protein (TIGR00698 family)